MGKKIRKIDSEKCYLSSEKCYLSLRRLKKLYKNWRIHWHTELQIQALWSAYEDAPEDCKESIKELLPVALINDGPIKYKDGETIDSRIYSLFEAYQCCKETQWLNLPGKKDFFLFKIIDSQCGLHAEYMKKEGFMKQSELEELGHPLDKVTNEDQFKAQIESLFDKIERTPPEQN